MASNKLINTILVVLCGMFFGFQANGQSTIRGDILEAENDNKLDSVEIKNIHTNQKTTTSANGLFSIDVNNGDLVEFHKKGFETLRIRISNAKMPSYYKLVLNKVRKNEVRDIYGHLIGYSRDSIEFYNTYSVILNGTKQGDNNACGGASLDALSKQNRERWAFQAMYKKWENEKYIDFVFNEELIKKITYLDGEELKQFMKIYRPSYDFTRNATRYDYLNYIKQSFYKFNAGKY